MADTKKKKKKKKPPFSQTPKLVKFTILPPPPPTHSPPHTVLAYVVGKNQSTPHLPWGKEGMSIHEIISIISPDKMSQSLRSQCPVFQNTLHKDGVVCIRITGACDHFF